MIRYSYRLIVAVVVLFDVIAFSKEVMVLPQFVCMYIMFAG